MAKPQLAKEAKDKLWNILKVEKNGKELYMNRISIDEEKYRDIYYTGYTVWFKNNSKHVMTRFDFLGLYSNGFYCIGSHSNSTQFVDAETFNRLLVNRGLGI